MPVTKSPASTPHARAGRTSRQAYDDAAVSQLTLVPGALAAYFVMLAVLHPVVFDEVASPWTTAAAVLSACVALVVAVLARRHAVPRRLAHPVVALLIALTVLVATVHGFVALEPDQTVSFCMILVATGTALLDRRWMVAAMVGTWLAWASVAVAIGGGPRSWSEWAFFLVTATLLGGVANAVRRSAIDTAEAALDVAVRAATEDQPTGLSNRRGLALLGAELVGIARRANEPVQCSFLDVDGLKAINDTFGHEVGDAVIAAVARALRACSRESDVVARWGGDEFVVIGLGPGIPVEDLEARIRSHLAEHHADDVTLTSRRISIGRAVRAPWEPGDLESLIEAADRDMYVRRALRGHRSLVPFSAHVHSLDVGA